LLFLRRKDYNKGSDDKEKTRCANQQSLGFLALNKKLNKRANRLSAQSRLNRPV
jgi:hypothetical protein